MQRSEVGLSPMQRSEVGYHPLYLMDNFVHHHGNNLAMASSQQLIRIDVIFGNLIKK